MADSVETSAQAISQPAQSNLPVKEEASNGGDQKNGENGKLESLGPRKRDGSHMQDNDSADGAAKRQKGVAAIKQEYIRPATAILRVHEVTHDLDTCYRFPVKLSKQRMVLKTTMLQKLPMIDTRKQMPVTAVIAVTTVKAVAKARRTTKKTKKRREARILAVPLAHRMTNYSCVLLVN